MKVGFPTVAKTILALALAIGGLALTARNVIAQSQPPRNQTQTQEGLPTTQKRILSKLGPEDVFGTPPDESRKNGGGSRQQRKLVPTPTPLQASTKDNIKSVAAPPMRSNQPTQSSVATPTANPTAEPNRTASAPVVNNEVQPSLGSTDDSAAKIASKWAAPMLIVLALIVSGALIFTLTKLVEKIRESSG